MDATAAVFTVIAVLIGLLIQYFIIKGAVVAALRQDRSEQKTVAGVTSSAPTPGEAKFFGDDSAK